MVYYGSSVWANHTFSLISFKVSLEDKMEERTKMLTALDSCCREEQDISEINNMASGGQMKSIFVGRWEREVSKRRQKYVGCQS